jgi:hypothetical protein
MDNHTTPTIMADSRNDPAPLFYDPIKSLDVRQDPDFESPRAIRNPDKPSGRKSAKPRQVRKPANRNQRLHLVLDDLSLLAGRLGRS